MNKKTNKLAYLRDGSLEKIFSVATGKKRKLTPEGSFKIVNKIKNRPYYKEKIPGGDPRNPLGDRWLGLDANGTKGTTYAIHGNNNKNSIGKYVSAGCIRMHNDEVHWLFNQVKIGTAVIIISSTLSFEEIAREHGYPIGGYKTFEGWLIINGKTVKLEQDLLLVDSRVFVPLRESFEWLGGEVSWRHRTKTVEGTIHNRTFSHKPLTGKAAVNGKEVSIIPSRYQGRILMMPLRNLAELTGYSVRWDGSTKAVMITLK